MSTDTAPRCSLCGGPVEEWPGGGGYGHNPEPLAAFDDRCCQVCNDTKVIPARLANLLEPRRRD